MSIEVHKNRILAERKAAEYIGISYSKLSKSRRTGARTGYMAPIPYIRCGRSILYRVSDLEEHLLRHRKGASETSAL